MKKAKVLLLSLFVAMFLAFSALAGQININTASQDELQTLPFIGPKIAERIVEYREKQGPFKSIDDLLKIKGIGQKKLEKIRPLVTTE